MTDSKQIDLTESELIRLVANKYLQVHYGGLTLDDLNTWYGKKLCKYITSIKGEQFEFVDLASSNAVQKITQELNVPNIYNIENMNLKKGDVIIDIGAGIGVFAIYLAKKHPYLKIYAFEPIKQNYDLILQNIEVNEIPEDVITVVNTPITGDAKQVSLMINPHNSTDIVPTRFNKSGYLIKPENQCLNSITLNEIFETYGLTKVKLLKIASEGYEFEILESCATNNLKKIEYLRGDIYENPRENPDNSARDLATYCKKHIKDVNFCILQRTVQ